MVVLRVWSLEQVLSWGQLVKLGRWALLGERLQELREESQGCRRAMASEVRQLEVLEPAGLVHVPVSISVLAA